MCTPPLSLLPPSPSTVVLAPTLWFLFWGLYGGLYVKTRGQTNGLFLCLLPPQYGASAEARIFPPQKALTLLRLLITAFVLWETGHTERGGKGCPKNICIECLRFFVCIHCHLCGVRSKWV